MQPDDLFVAHNGHVAWIHDRDFGTGQSKYLEVGPSPGEMDLDSSDNLYVAESEDGKVVKFNRTGERVPGFSPSLPDATGLPNATGLVVDAADAVYVGLNRPGTDANGQSQVNLVKLDGSGNTLATFSLQTASRRPGSITEEPSSVRSLDLGGDGCTLYYASEQVIKRYNVCPHPRPLPDFAPVPNGYHLQVRVFLNSNGEEEAIVSTYYDIKRIAFPGIVKSVYRAPPPMAGELYKAITLNPGCSSFWAVGIGGNTYLFDIESSQGMTVGDAGEVMMPSSVLVRGPDSPGKAPAATISNATVTEGTEKPETLEDKVKGNIQGSVQAKSVATLQISLSDRPTQSVTLQVGTDPGTAAEGSDFHPVSREVKIPCGARSAAVDVEIVGDGVDEPDERFFVNMQTGPGLTGGPARATVDILDDDDPPPPAAPGDQDPDPDPEPDEGEPDPPDEEDPAETLRREREAQNRGQVTLAQGSPGEVQVPTQAGSQQANAQQANAQQTQAHQALQANAQQAKSQQAQAAQLEGEQVSVQLAEQQQAQVQLQQQAQAQAQSASQAQPGMMLERQREIEVEVARVDGRRAGRQTFLASAREPAVPTGVAAGAAAALMTFALALVAGRPPARAQTIPVPGRNPVSVKPSRSRRRR